MLAQILRALGYGLCHQLTARSFVTGGIQAPVCARDTGIYVGFVVSVLILQRIGRARRSEPPRWPVVVMAACFILIMGIDGINSNTGLLDAVYTTTNGTRLLTGTMAGFAISLFATPIVNGQLWRTPSFERVLDGRGEVAVWAAGVPATYLLVQVLLRVGLVFPLVVAVCIVATFWWVNLAIVCMLPLFERRAARLAQAWPAHLLAIGFTALELAAGSLFRSIVERLAGAVG